MSTNVALPVPVTLTLPNDKWVETDPGQLGVGNAALLALRKDMPGTYVPTLTVSGDWRNDPASLDMIADESNRLLRSEGATELEVIDRQVHGTEKAPGLLQLVSARLNVRGVWYDLRRMQAFVSVLDVNDPHRRVVLVHTLDCTFAQQDQMAREFQTYLRHVRVHQPPAPEEDADGRRP